MSRILNKYLEIKTVCVSNKFDFVVCGIFTTWVVAANIFFPNPQSMDNGILTIIFFMLLGLFYKLSEIAGYFKCMLPAIEHIKILVNSNGK